MIKTINKGYNIYLIKVLNSLLIPKINRHYYITENKQNLVEISIKVSTTGREMSKFSEVVHMKHRHLLLEQP